MLPHSFDIKGACHCGAIQFLLGWPKSVGEMKARACGCTFCQKHGGVWTSDTKASLSIEIVDSALVSVYKFGTESASFYVCARCGVTPFVLSEIGGITYSVVNVNALADLGELTLSKSSSSFEAEDLDARLERRQRNWISSVQFQSPISER